MFLTSLLLTAAPVLSTPAPQDRRQEVAKQYHALAAAQDAEGLGELWKKNVGLVLQTIDADLEGSLALWENDPENPPKEEIAALHNRALFGARVASKALEQPIFLDYTSSFVGWSDVQKHAFRNGQQVYGRAMAELKKEEYSNAFEAGKETVERASALGDWWGTAMGYGAQAMAAQQMGLFEDSLLAFGMARQINHALGLRQSEYRNLQGMLTVSLAAEFTYRAHACAGDLADMAEAFGDKKTLKSSLETKAKLEKQLGMEKAAARTAERLGAIGG